MTPEQIAAVRKRAARVQEYLRFVDGSLLEGFMTKDVPALLDEIAFLTERLERANADYDACAKRCQQLEHDLDSE